MTLFKMPSLGADMEFGYLVEWFVKPGDSVSRGDIIADVETQKGVIAVECFVDGVIEELLIEAGREEIPIGTPLAVILTEEDEEIVARETPVPTAPVHEQVPVLAGTETGSHGVFASPVARNVARELHVDLSDVTGSGPRGMITRHDVERVAQPPETAPSRKRVRISPAARRLADTLCVEIHTLTGSGPGGAITISDVEQAAAAKTPAKSAFVEREPQQTSFADGMRQAIAKAMSKSNRDIPHYYLETTIDMTHAQAWLERENLNRSIRDRLIMPVVLLKAVATALEAVPALNGFWLDDQLQTSEAIHIGFAIALRGSGLVTPAIHSVNEKNPDELMSALTDLIKRTRAGKLRSSELMDATITVTNLGDLGVETVFGVIYPPQVALVGLGKIREIPWAENGMIGVRPVLKATLAADHRATDGRIGGQFLDSLDKSLQEVDKLWTLN